MNSLELFYEEFGAADAVPVLLIMGNSAPGLVWPDAFCTKLAAGGFRIIRFDQRDSGLSSYFDFDTHPYTLDDLAADAFGLLDALNIETAHVVGLSQGGTVAYRMGLASAQIKSVAVIMSSPNMQPKNDAFAGVPPRPGELPRPSADYVAKVISLNSVKAEGVAAQAQRFADNFRLAKGPASPFDAEFWADLGRAFAELPLLRKDKLTAAMANNSNNTKAQLVSPPLTGTELQSLQQPVLILHGTGDPIFPIAHASWAAGIIPNAKLIEIADMGHALDPAFFAPIESALSQFWRGCF